ncbi:WD repeat-containing protein 53-like [Mya arenaria]|uniref:WD repeat-containing protein 53-like n=1 Tax=Mya arenaria TaxID=6604 RepID=UPI0022E89124|nr:WD repeat-containing protein 53-like [Mya arenaria]
MADADVEILLKFEGGHTNTILCVDSTPDGSKIVSGGEEGEICIWARNGNLLHRLPSQDHDCTSVTLSKSNSNIFYAAVGTTVKVFDDRDLQAAVETYQFNEDEINQLVLDEKDQYLAACDDSGEIKIISLQEKRLYKTLRRKHTNICSTACFRVRKPWEIFTGGMDCNLIHWDFSRPKCVNQFSMQELQDAPSELGVYMVNPPFLHHLSMSPDGKYLACALENGFVSIFDATKKQISELFTLHGHTQGVSQVTFITETKLITGGNDCAINAWDLAKMEEDNDQMPHNATNGHASPIHNRNSYITDCCKIGEIHHESKINWLKYFAHEERSFVLVADQTSALTMIPVFQM